MAVSRILSPALSTGEWSSIWGLASRWASCLLP